MFNKRLESFKYAFQGIADLFRTQPNTRIHLAAAIAVVTTGSLLGLQATEWAVIAVCIAMVFAAEALNTAIEYLTDLASPEYHLLAGKAKDAAAGGVLFAAMGAATAGLFIFVPKLLEIFF
jgi:diacylglycerol kinase